MDKLPEPPITDLPAAARPAPSDAAPASAMHIAAETAEALVTLNLLRDAYRVGADAMLKGGFRVADTAALLELLPQNRRAALQPDYYRKLHDENVGYKQNNWLVDYLPVLLRLDVQHVVEVGCGNGIFLRNAAPLVARVTGCDWVETPTLPRDLPNVDFKQLDLTQGDVPRGDIVCSADVLEHIPVESVPDVLDRLVAAAPLQFHVIACYDDAHSHLSVFDPATWLALFRRVLPDAWLFDIAPRYGDSARPICVITNAPARVIGNPPRVEQTPAVASARSVPAADLPSPLRLDLGAAAVRAPGFLSVDVREESGADIIANMTELPETLKGKVDEIRCRHALEHLERGEARDALQIWRTFLKPGARLNIIVPDLAFHARQFLGEQTSSFPDQRAHAMAGFYGWSGADRGGAQWDNHRWGYCFDSLRALLADCGYTHIVRETEGADSAPWHLNVTCAAPAPD